MNTQARAMISMITNLRVKRMPSMEKLVAIGRIGQQADGALKVPAGQMYLQNAGTR